MHIASTVTEDDIRPILSGIDPTAPGYGMHLPFYLVLLRCGLAWRKFLLSLDGFADGVIVPHLSADFAAEVNVGELEVELQVTKIGTTSFTLRCTVRQDSTEAAYVDVVLVNFDYAGGSPLALTAYQRDQLERVQLKNAS
jgi:acyl-CoA thioester hydrolase